MDQPMKILYAASTDAHLRSFHLPYLAALRDGGCAVTAAAAGDGHGLPEGVGFFPVPFTKRMLSPRNFRGALALSKLLRREGFDEVVTHTSLAAFFTRLAVMLSGRRPRVVNVVHGYLFDRETPLLRRSVLLGAEKLTAGVTDDLLVMNRADEQIARAHRLCRGRCVRIDGMGVPLERFPAVSSAERAAAKRSLGLPEEALTLLCAAEFSSRKNQRTLLRALALLPEDVVLLLPGDGALLPACREEAARLGLGGRVVFPGHVSDVGPWLRAADVCVSAARSEGLPFHVMEAMSCALPCVLSDVKGHEDLLAGAGCGRLYPYGDARALALAVEELRGDPRLRRSMGRRAAEAVRKFDLRTVLPQVLPWFTTAARK